MFKPLLCITLLLTASSNLVAAMPPGPSAEPGSSTDVCLPPRHRCTPPGQASVCCDFLSRCDTITGACIDPNFCGGTTVCDPATHDCLGGNTCCPKEISCSGTCCPPNRPDDFITYAAVPLPDGGCACCEQGQTVSADGTCTWPCGGVECFGNQTCVNDKCCSRPCGAVCCESPFANVQVVCADAVNGICRVVSPPWIGGG